MANTIFQLRRNAVSGTRPTTTTVSSGELAINTTDGILFSANATGVFEIGSNNTNIAVGNSSSRFIVNTTAIAISNSQGLIANGSFGTANQVLASNGSGVYWTTAGAGSASASVRQTFTANSTVNTTFTVSGGYTVGYVDVYYNGAKLVNGTDVTVTNGSTVVLSAAAPLNSVIDVVGLTSNAITAKIINYRSVTSNTTVLATDNLILANGTLTITLPAAGSVAGQQFYIKNISNINSIITVLPNGSELIDGYANATIRYYNTMFGVISVGTGWVIF